MFDIVVDMIIGAIGDVFGYMLSEKARRSFEIGMYIVFALFVVGIVGVIVAINLR